MSEQQKNASAKIAEYLELGGFFNPELMDPEAVRDMVIDARDELKALRAALAEAKGALEPFAIASKSADAHATINNYGPIPDSYQHTWSLSFGHLRTAAIVFAKLTEILK